MLNRDRYGRYMECLQCGYERDAGEVVKVKEQGAKQEKVLVSVHG